MDNVGRIEEARKKRNKLDKYRCPKRRINKIKWPGTDNDVGFLYLSFAEVQQAWFAARSHFEKNGQAIDTANFDHLNYEFGVQIVTRMLLDPECAEFDAKFLVFSEAAEVRAKLTPNEIDLFADHHVQQQTDERADWGVDRQLNPHLHRIADICGIPKDSSGEDIELAVSELFIKAASN